MASTTFARRVLAILRRIPSGRVITYGDLAAMAGRPGAARAAGNVLRDAAESGLPYHRVIAAGGRIGSYGSGPSLKRSLLIADGIGCSRTRVLDFERRRWTGRR